MEPIDQIDQLLTALENTFNTGATHITSLAQAASAIQASLDAKTKEHEDYRARVASMVSRLEAMVNTSTQITG